MYEADDSVYARQLSGTFASLRFDPALEQEFRSYYAVQNLPFVRLALTLGLLFVCGRALLDLLFSPAELFGEATVLRAGVLLPAMILALRSTYPGRLARFSGTLVFATGALICGAGMVLLWRGGEMLDVADVLVITVFLYLMLGLRLFPTLWLALPSLGGAFWFGRSGQPVEYYSAMLTIVFIHLGAALACYRLEHSARTIFLEREIRSRAAGVDLPTGIPNRKMFTTHLQRVIRQAQREGRGLALALVEIDDLDSYRKRYGQLATEMSIRRVAHAIMRSAQRPLDFVARHAAGQFMMVFFDPDQRYVEKVVGDVRGEVAKLDITHEGSQVGPRLTVSIGVSLSEAGNQHRTRSLIKSASEALDTAKVQGQMIVQDASRTGSEAQVYVGPWPSSSG